jgi:hypothetical protein
VSESLAAATFYVGLVGMVAGAIILARGAVERRPARDRLGLLLLGIGVLGIVVSLVVYMTGPKSMLPF